MLIAALEIAMASRADAGERSVRAPVTVPDEQLDFLADFYLANRVLRVRHATFEGFVLYVVRNGTLFEKVSCPRARRHGGNDFRRRGGAA